MSHPFAFANLISLEMKSDIWCLCVCVLCVFCNMLTISLKSLYGKQGTNNQLYACPKESDRTRKVYTIKFRQEEE